MGNSIVLLKDSVAKKVHNDKKILKELSIVMDRDVQTITRWAADNSINLTLYSCYTHIQKEYKLSDKQLFNFK